MLRGLRIIAIFGLSIGCGSTDAVGPDVLIGTYQATEFKITRSGQATVDILALGGSVTWQLNVGLTTGGRLLIPVSAGLSTQPIDESLVGQYQVISKSTIRYQSTNDEGFIDDYIFTSDPPELRAFLTLVNPSGQISLVLRKQ